MIRLGGWNGLDGGRGGEIRDEDFFFYDYFSLTMYILSLILLYVYNIRIIICDINEFFKQQEEEKLCECEWGNRVSIRMEVREKFFSYNFI